MQLNALRIYSIKYLLIRQILTKTLNWEAYTQTQRMRERDRRRECPCNYCHWAAGLNWRRHWTFITKSSAVFANYAGLVEHNESDPLRLKSFTKCKGLVFCKLCPEQWPLFFSSLYTGRGESYLMLNKLLIVSEWLELWRLVMWGIPSSESKFTKFVCTKNNAQALYALYELKNFVHTF